MAGIEHREIVSSRLGLADIIRDTAKRGKYQDVIVAPTVAQWLGWVLASHQADAAVGPGQVQGRAGAATPMGLFCRDS